MNTARVLTDYLVQHGALPAYKAADDYLTQAEERLTQRLNRLFEGVQNRLISKLRDLGYIPADPDRRQEFLLEFLGHLYDDLPEEVARAALEHAEAGRLLTFQELTAFGFTFSYSTFDPWIRARLAEKFYQFSQETARRIVGDVAKNLAESYEMGIGIKEAAVRLREVIDETREYRLRRIARTEINSAQSEGKFRTMKELGVQYHQWLTAQDERVRRKPRDKADHVILHGQVVRVGERFSNGLLHPGDREGTPIEEWINCRCTIRAYIPRPGEMILVTPYYP